MGLFNTVTGPLTCPRCGAGVEVEVETRLGYVHLVQTLRIGDRYPWGHPELTPARPDGGNAIGEGYAECPACGRDFFCRVIVEGDVIRRVESVPDWPGRLSEGA